VSATVDARLDAALVRIEQIASGTDAPVQFGLLDNWDHAITRLGSLFDQLTHYAWVDSVEGGASAKTVVSWKGDFKTVWAAGLSDHQIDAQFGAVESALLFRAKLILVLTAATHTALVISAGLAAPVTAVSAMSSISRLVSELQDLVILAQHR